MVAETSSYREGFEYEFSLLDPHSAHIDPPAVAVYETLLTRGADGTPKPRLAQSWTVSDSGLSWDLKLRSDARFHSGSQCDAYAVVEALDALRWDMHVLPGGRQLWYWDPVDRVEALDRETIRINLHYVHTRLFSLLWGTHTAIHNERLRQADPSTFGIEYADGTGPYQLRAWRPGRIDTVRADGRRGFVNDASWIALTDTRDRAAALLSGEVDCVHALDSVAVDTIRDDPRFIFSRQPQPSSMYLTLDWRRSDLDFDRLDLRRALSMAINRHRLVSEALGGLGTPSWGPIPPGHDFYEARADVGRPKDLEAARDLLETLGWARGPDGVRQRRGTDLAFECVVQDDDTFRAVAALVVDDLREIGVDVRLRFARPFAEFYAEVQFGPDASISKWLWPDPIEALRGFNSTSTAPFPNWQHSSVPALDAAFDSFLHAEGDGDLQIAASTIQSIFADQLPYIPLLTPDDVWAWRSDLNGFQPRRGDLYPLYDEISWTAKR